MDAKTETPDAFDRIEVAARIEAAQVDSGWSVDLTPSDLRALLDEIDRLRTRLEEAQERIAVLEAMTTARNGPMSTSSAWLTPSPTTENNE